MPSHQIAPLVARQDLGSGYALLTFRHAEVACHARAGQFVMIKAGTSCEPPLRRPFSVMAVEPDTGTFTLFVKAVGPGSSALLALAPGDPSLCLGPLGRGFEPPAAGRRAWLVAGGYGVAPFLLLSNQWSGHGTRPRLFYGGRAAADLPLREVVAGLDVDLELATEDGSLGHPGRVTAPLEARLDREGPDGAALYACGPEPMMRAVARIAEARGVPCQVSLDPWMGCGLGTCLGCVVWIREPGRDRPRYRCACTDGPVFEAASVVWPDSHAHGVPAS